MIPALFVISRVGSRRLWGLELLDGAVVCDEHCFAVGVEIVVVAGDMAATNLMSQPEERKPFRAVSTFWSDQCDVKIKSAGLLSIADRWVVLEEDPEAGTLVVEAHQADTLVGAIGLNRPRALIDYQRRLAGELDH